MNVPEVNVHTAGLHYFFSYLLTCEVDLIEVLEIMAQIWQYIILLSHTCLINEQARLRFFPIFTYM